MESYPKKDLNGMEGVHYSMPLYRNKNTGTNKMLQYTFGP